MNWSRPHANLAGLSTCGPMRLRWLMLVCSRTKGQRLMHWLQAAPGLRPAAYLRIRGARRALVGSGYGMRTPFRKRIGL